MRNLLLTIMLFLPMVAVASDDQTIMFEIGIGFGNASGGRTDGNDNAKWCKNRNTGRMTYGAIRYSYDDVEVHVARWFHDEEVANCDRDMWAVGAGYVIDTQGDGKAGTDDVYASWTPGFAYVWGDNSDFTGKDSDSTNWRQTSNWQTFNRFAVGAGGNDGAVEIAAHRYGTFNPEHGEYFATVGLQLRDLDDSANTGGDRGLTEPTIINNYNTVNEGDSINIYKIDESFNGDVIITGGQQDTAATLD